MPDIDTRALVADQGAAPAPVRQPAAPQDKAAGDAGKPAAGGDQPAAEAEFINVSFVAKASDDAAKKDDSAKGGAGDGTAKLVRNTLKRTDSLAELRKLLAAQVDMASNDRFLSLGAEVSPGQEKDITIEKAFAAEALKPPQWKVQVKRSAASVAAAAAPAFLTAETLNRPLDMTSRVDDRVLKLLGSKTEGEQHFDALTVAEELRLYDRMNVFRGLVFINGTVTWSYRNGLIPDVRLRPEYQLKPDDRPLYDALEKRILAQIPHQSFFQNEVFTFDKTESEVKKVVAWSGGASVRYGVATVGAEYATSTGTRDANQTQKFYCYSEMIVPKAQIYLPNLMAAAPLVTALGRFEGRSGTDYQDYDDLYQLFRTWGAYFARELIIGGKLYVTETKDLKGSVNETAEKNSFRASVKLEFVTAGVGVSAGREKGEQTSTGQANQSRLSMMQAFGGDPGLVATEASKWVASLGPATSWRVCKVADLIPIHHFASNKAARGIYNTLIHWEALWRQSNIMLTYDDFLEPLRQKFGRLKLTVKSQIVGKGAAS